MKINIVAASTPLASTVIVGVNADLNLPKSARELDKESNGSIKKALDMGTFKGAIGDSLIVIMPAGSQIMAVMLIGLGKISEFHEKEAINLGGKIYSEINAHKIKRAQIIADFTNKSLSSEKLAASIGLGLALRSYSFDKYRSAEFKKERHEVAAIDILAENEKDAKKLLADYMHIAAGVSLTKTFVTEPPNKLYPASYAEQIKEELESCGVKVTILGVKELTKLGAGAILGVGQGSIHEPKLVVMEYNGGSAKEKPIAFVGKGVTFDSGGISLKQATGMEDMKYDMAGSATVVGLLKTLALRKAKVNVVGVCGLVENMPGGKAQRPSDVVTSMSGKTIEVLNTDAEGRLVLADALWYCQDKFKPKFMIDLATLTGAIVISLGVHKAGLFSNDDELAEKLFKAGEKVAEPLWRLPMGKEYDDSMKSEIADIANMSDGKGAGSICAAGFLKKFINDVPWAHLDIAGVAWNKKGTDISVKGATAFGVRLLNQLIADNYE
jgi:leucyl aminopeptidase